MLRAAGTIDNTGTIGSAIEAADFAIHERQCWVEF